MADDMNQTHLILLFTECFEYISKYFTPPLSHLNKTSIIVIALMHFEHPFKEHTPRASGRRLRSRFKSLSQISRTLISFDRRNKLT